MPFSRGSSQPRSQSWVSCTAGRFFTIRATREVKDLETGCGGRIRTLGSGPTPAVTPGLGQVLLEVSGPIRKGSLPWFQ